MPINKQDKRPRKKDKAIDRFKKYGKNTPKGERIKQEKVVNSLKKK